MREPRVVRAVLQPGVLRGCYLIGHFLLLGEVLFGGTRRFTAMRYLGITHLGRGFRTKNRPLYCLSAGAGLQSKQMQVLLNTCLMINVCYHQKKTLLWYSRAIRTDTSCLTSHVSATQRPYNAIRFALETRFYR